MSAMRKRLNMVRSEEGIAIVIAMMVLLLIGIFAATVATGSVSLSRHANKDKNQKKALAAAEAGMRRMMFMLNKTGESLCTPADLQSGDITVPGGITVSGALQYDCARSEFLNQALGNGASYSTYMTPILSATAVSTNLQLNSCIGLPIDDLRLSGGDIVRTIPINQRCITSFGSAGDVQVRTEARVAALFASQLFKVGLTGRERTCIAGISSGCPVNNGGGGGQGQAQIFSDIGSNVLIDTGAIETCGNRFIAPGGQALNGANCTTVPYPGANFPSGLPTKSSYTCLNAAGCPPGTVVSNPQPPPDVDIYFKNYQTTRCINSPDPTVCTATLPVGLPVGSVVTGDTSTVNDIGKLAALFPPSPTGDTNCKVAQGAGYDSATRTLNLNGCKDILLPPGTYNVCAITNTGNLSTFGAKATVDPLTNPNLLNPVILMLDSSARTGSGCSGIADFIMGNNSSLVVPTLPAPTSSPDALAFEIFAKGNPNCADWSTIAVCSNAPQAPHRIQISNGGAGASVGAGIFAPNSEVAIQNSGNSKVTLTGAFYARWLDISNGFQFREDPRYSTQSGPADVKPYSRTAWRQCPSSGFSGTVRSGC
jgi:Tfp pilus assembly protein PilX